MMIDELLTKLVTEENISNRRVQVSNPDSTENQLPADVVWKLGMGGSRPGVNHHLIAVQNYETTRCPWQAISRLMNGINSLLCSMESGGGAGAAGFGNLVLSLKGGGMGEKKLPLFADETFRGVETGIRPELKLLTILIFYKFFVS
ncbi:hypothetical protein AVEN_117597-1 [Araneus ventricosus]|uniref:Uncharacterized protein n=1 Tax=Araneus ventricosus TaxID=182803 RepID=A0A4Y2GB28_ARAVE|nr:hypothetical protein AVEN_117597-1 [Araneus ventricosus]